MKQSIKGIEEWDKEFHPFLNLLVIASSYGPGKREDTICYKCIHWKWKILEFIETIKKVKSKFTIGLAPSVKKISFGSTGKPSRASIPAAIVSRNPLIP